jgi:radical SAM superfamily enzyme YgiQ (UPF0313 family)
MKILLVNGNNDEQHKSLDSGYNKDNPSLSLISIKEFVEHYNPNTKIVIADGIIHTEKEVKKIIEENAKDTNVVGFSGLFYNRTSNIELSKLVKELNPSVKRIFGNVDAGALAKNYIAKGIADIVYRGYAEQFMLQISKGNFPKDKLITFFNRKKYETDINKIPLLTFKGFEKYLTAYDSRLPTYNQDLISPFPISGIRGCEKSSQKGPCKYCTIDNRNVQVQKRDLFWKENKYLYENLGIKFFFETGDSFLIGNVPQITLETMPNNLKGKIDLRVYGNLEQITEENIKIIKKIGVNTFFPGIENVNESVLKDANKRYNFNYTNFKDFWEKLDILNEHEIDFYIPLLYGMGKENKEALKENIKFVQEAIHRYPKHFKKLYCDIFVPLPSSSYFNILVHNNNFCKDYEKAHEYYYGKNEDNDLVTTVKPDETLMIMLMGKYLWKDVSFKEVYKAVQETINIAKSAGIHAPTNFGILPFEKYEKI